MIRIVLAGAGGSCGKTTEAVNLAAALAQRGNTVRVHDLDGQGDASTYLGYQEAPYVIADVLAQEKVFVEPVQPGDDTKDVDRPRRAPTMSEVVVPIYRESEKEAKKLGGLTSPRPETAEWLRRMTLVPSGVGPGGATLPAAVAALERDPMGGDRLRQHLTALPADVDYELWDLHGTVGILTYHALRLADRVLTTVVPDDKTTGRHLGELVAIITEVGELGGTGRLDAIIPVRCRPSRDGRYYTEVVSALEENEAYGHLVTPRIREAVVVPESYAEREPLPLYVPRDPVTHDHYRVLEWLDGQGVTR